MFRTVFLLSSATAASAATGACVYTSDDGAHPSVDLNVLHSSSADYSVTSITNDAFSYQFNVCGDVVKQDGTCSTGSTMCEWKDGTAMDVYGYSSTIGLHWDDDTLVLTQTGEAVCPFNQRNAYTSRIYFQCSEETSISLRTEAYYQCMLEFDFKTPVACGNTVNYRCEDYQCVIDDAGSFNSYSSCASDCLPPSPPPPPPGSRYQCTSDFQCVSADEGHFLSSDDCESLCMPWQARYSCYEQRCVRNSRGTFTSEGDCVESCSSTATKWACNNGACTQSYSGAYSSQWACQQACSAGATEQPSTLWSCDSAQGGCVQSNYGVADESLCNSICAASVSAGADENGKSNSSVATTGSRGQSAPVANE